MFARRLTPKERMMIAATHPKDHLQVWQTLGRERTEIASRIVTLKRCHALINARLPSSQLVFCDAMNMDLSDAVTAVKIAHRIGLSEAPGKTYWSCLYKHYKNPLFRRHIIGPNSMLYVLQIAEDHILMNENAAVRRTQ